MKKLFKLNFWIIIFFIAISFCSSLYAVGNQGGSTIYLSYFGFFLCMFNMVSCFFSRTKKSKIDKSLVCFIIVVVLITLVHYVEFGNASIQYLAMVDLIGSALAYLLCRELFKRDYYFLSKVRNIFIILYFIFAILFLTFRFSDRFSIFGGSLHVSYYVAFLLPVIYTCDKAWVKYLATMLAFVVSFFSYKRGAVFAIGASSLIFFISQIFYGGLRSRVFNFTMIAIILYYLVYFFSSGADDVEYMMNRISGMEDDRGSGRGDIYEFFLAQIGDFNLFDYFFGRGGKATIVVNNGMTAHNDWIELFYDYGIFVFVLWLVFIVRQISVLRMMYHGYAPVSLATLCILLCYLITSSVSHVFFFGYSYLFMIILAYLISIAESYEDRYPNVLQCN